MVLFELCALPLIQEHFSTIRHLVFRTDSVGKMGCCTAESTGANQPFLSAWRKAIKRSLPNLETVTWQNAEVNFDLANMRGLMGLAVTCSTLDIECHNVKVSRDDTFDFEHWCVSWFIEKAKLVQQRDESL
ncbi:hypothetical protein JCM3766R1_003290 [Sporobolomyces carnicolor]